MMLTNQRFSNFYHSILHSYTMVFFSKNQLFGLLLLAVTFFDVYVGLAGLLSVVIANSFAWIFGLNKSNIHTGLYGFNALLVGLGLGISFQPAIAFYFILIFVALATLLFTLAFEGITSKYGLPFLTLPFLASLWFTLLASRSYTALIPGESGIFILNNLYARGGYTLVEWYQWFGNLSWPLVIKVYFRSLGAIFFQYHLLAGVIIAIGLLIYSRIAFLLSIVGFAFTWLFYSVIGANMHELDYSYIGFNHILTAIAVGGFFVVASRWSLLWVILLTPVISLFISGSFVLLAPLQLPVFSLPFNLTVLLFLYALKFREKRLHQPEQVLNQHFTPEKNLYLSQNERKRFPNQQYIDIQLPFFGIWKVNQGHDGTYTHKEQWQHAWDFVIRDESDKEHAEAGDKLTDYYCYGKPVIAPAGGWVEEVVDGIADNTPGEYNTLNNWGNTVIIRHNQWLYSKLSHLKKDSITVSPGVYIQQGQSVGSCGNSGFAAYPHLHFQMQSAPYIGSHTLKYPMAHYLLHGKNLTLKTNDYPRLDEQVANILADASLAAAFNFGTGNSIAYSTDSNRLGNGTWVVENDLWMNRFITDTKTNARAYFVNDGQLFYFTRFEGNRQCLLWYFFLAAFRLPLGFYAGLEVNDHFPPNIFPKGGLLLLQDFAAPFFIFLKPAFQLKYASCNNDLAGNLISLHSSFRPGNGQAPMQFDIAVLNRLLTFSIHTGKQEITAAFEY
jgi:urea transporter